MGCGHRGVPPFRMVKVSLGLAAFFLNPFVRNLPLKRPTCEIGQSIKVTPVFLL